MKKSFRFLWQFEWTYLATIVCFAAAITFLSQFGGAGGRQDRLTFFQTYFASYALLELLFLFIFGFALSSAYLNIALSFGARRSDYFKAVQLYMLSMAAAAWAVQQVMSRLPALLDWYNAEVWELLLTLGGMPPWVFPVAALTVQAAGSMLGLLMSRHKVLGILAMVLVMFLCIGGVVALMLAFDVIHEAGISSSGLWGWVPAIVGALCLALLGGSEWMLGRYVKSFCVR